jgi:lysophospholipid acyltransferase (LPLAT)-like uncharacterized protein
VTASANTANEERRRTDKARRRSRFKQRRRRLGQALAANAGHGLVAALARTWRFETEGEERFEAALADTGCLITLWHGRLLMGVQRFAHREFRVLVSHSGDGEMMHRLLGSFGYGTIRGSSSKGAPRAVREMLQGLKDAPAVVITPDGPRGPRHSMNPGLAWLAQASGRPVVPFGFACDRAWRFNSWDKACMPKPFAKVRLHYGEPLHLARRATEEQQSEFTERVQAALISAERSAFAALGREADF